MRKALFLDRDGTINEYGEYIYQIKDFRFIDGAIEFIKEYNDKGYLVFVVSNQAGIGRGYYSKDDLQVLQRWVDEQLSMHGAHVDEWIYCPHHPTHGIGEYKVDCDCRKPKSGMIDYACKKYDIDRRASIMVGDKIWDYECGVNAGVQAFLLDEDGYEGIKKKIENAS